MSMRGRLLIMLLVGLTVVVAAGGAGVYWIADSSLTRQFDAGLETGAQTLASLVAYEPPRLTFDSDDAQAMLGDTVYEVRTITDELLKRSRNLGGARLPARRLDGESAAADLQFGDVALAEDVSGRAAWLVFRPHTEEPDEDEEDDEDEFVGGAPLIAPELCVAVVALDRSPVDRALATLLGALLGVGGVLGLTVVVLVLLGVRWGFVPLDRLRDQLGDVDGESISRRLDGAGAPRELEPVYRELNRMLDRVERTIVRERSFADAAAHELRTPLAELRTTAEVALRWPDEKRAASALEEALGVGREMERLVESLLQLSRGHAAELDGADARTPMAPIVRGCLDRAADSITAKHLTLAVDLDERTTVQGPPDAAEIIVRNLIDNAVHYTPANGAISVIGNGSANGHPLLVVENDPVRLEAGDVERLFDPFWRLEQARTDRTHAGLGLSVVRQVARAIGLRVDAELDGRRLRMSVGRS